MSTEQKGRRDALAIWRRGVEAAHAGTLVSRAIRVRGNTLIVSGSTRSLSTTRNLVVVGAGKAAAPMARALERALGPRVLAAKNAKGWVNVPLHHAGTSPPGCTVLHPSRVTHHNMPTRAGVRGSMRMLDLVRDLGPRDLVFCLISGGGSALWPAPAGRVTLADKARMTRLLHAVGATVNDMNAVRKHLSLTKGGGLVRATRARIVSLIVSDVVGDPLDVIASGPTAPDPTSYGDALEVLRRHRLLQRSPRRVVEHLWEGARGRHPETWKGRRSGVENHLLGNNDTALRAAAREARTRGYRVINLSSFLEGESRELGATLAALARGVRDQGKPQAAPACLLSGGETTVTLGSRPGKGGRNQELVLGALAHLEAVGMGGITVLSGGTDGEDGPTDAAGAVADAALLRRARLRNLVPGTYLSRHDAYRFFDPLGGLIRVGPTHTNVMDLRVVLVQAG
jgi:glycerate-2-kinase